MTWILESTFFFFLLTTTGLFWISLFYEMEIVIQDSPGFFFIRLKSITGKYLETKVKTGMIEPLLKDQYPLFVLNHMIKFSQKVPLRYVTYPGIIF